MNVLGYFLIFATVLAVASSAAIEKRSAKYKYEPNPNSYESYYRTEEDQEIYEIFNANDIDNDYNKKLQFLAVFAPTTFIIGVLNLFVYFMVRYFVSTVINWVIRAVVTYLQIE